MTLAVSGLFIISACGQNFQNLNFESAFSLPGNPPANGASVSVTDALPDWTAYDGTLAYSDIYYVSNNFPGGVSSVVELEGGSLALNGDFSIGLYSISSISQTGLVPANAGSLQFEAKGPGSGGSLGASGLAVTLGGQNLSFSALSTGPDYIVYAANIPASMEGLAEKLTFLTQGLGSGDVLLDNIQFSTMSVPEPSEWAFMGISAVFLGLRHLRQKNHRNPRR